MRPVRTLPVATIRSQDGSGVACELIGRKIERLSSIAFVVLELYGKAVFDSAHDDKKLWRSHPTFREWAVVPDCRSANLVIDTRHEQSRPDAGPFLRTVDVRH